MSEGLSMKIGEVLYLGALHTDKRPGLYLIQNGGPVYHKVASFRSEEAALEFVAHLGQMVPLLHEKVEGG